MLKVLGGKNGGGQMRVRIRYHWHDNDILQIQVDATNGDFAGTAEPYVGIGELERLSEALNGFPRTGPVEWSCGQSNIDSLHLNFHTINQAGHCAVRVRISRHLGESSPRETGDFVIRCEPAALDRFASGLRAVGADKQGEASLD